MFELFCSIFNYICVNPYTEYGFTKLLNTDPIWILNHNTVPIKRGEACGHPSLLSEKPPSVSTFICMAKPGVGGEQLW